MKRVIESLSFGIILVVVALRPLVAESYDSAGNPMTAALDLVSDPTPVRTLVFDMAILLAAVGWLVARALGAHQPYRRTGLEWGMLIIVPAAIVSCCFAGQKRLAINATVDWLCYLVLTIVLVQLLRHRWRQRVLIAAIAGTACVQAFQCFDQYFVGFEDTWAQYEQIKDEFWARQGVDQDSAKVELFENRIQARESSGFLPHSNVTGSYLMLCGLVVVGVSVSGLRRSKEIKNVLATVGCGVLAAGILAAVLTTKSNGAIVAGAIGLGALILIRLTRHWIDSHRKHVLLIGWSLAAIGLSSTVALGLMNDRLPHMSLTFRWQYWKASAQLIADHPLVGVGRENFGRHYLQYKTIDSPEEVSNPHDLFVQVAADWGLPGLAGLIVAMIGLSLTLARRPHDQTDGGGQDRKVNRLRPEIWWGLFAIAALALFRLPLLDAPAPEFWGYAYYVTVVTVVVWVAGYLLVMFAAGNVSSTGPSCGPILGSAGVVAVMAFILQDLINFALFAPASASTFFAVLALCLSERVPIGATDPQCGNRKRWVRPLGAGVGLAAVLVVCVLPVIRSSSSLAQATYLQNRVTPGPVRAQLAFAHYERAASVDSLDPTAMARRAAWLLRLSTLPDYEDEALTLAVSSAESARARDPFSVSHCRLLSRLHMVRAASTGTSKDYLAAVEAAETALQLYPGDPAGMTALGDRLAEAGKALNDADLDRRAVAMYKSALALDAARPEWERIRGFRLREIEAIQQQIVDIERRVSVP